MTRVDTIPASTIAPVPSQISPGVRRGAAGLETGAPLPASAFAAINRGRPTAPVDILDIPAPSELETPREERTRGVVRLLEEGHFHGVADVRLRINFFEELSARASERTHAALAAEADSLTDGVTQAAADAFAPLSVEESAQRQIDEALAAFAEAVGTATAPSAAGALDLTELGEAIRAAFGTLVDQTRSILAAPVVRVPEGDVTAVVPAVEPTPDAATSELDSAIGLLTAAFEELWANLRQTLDAVQSRPELSSPSGEGRAYDKFLAEYDALTRFGQAVEVVG